MSRAVPSPQGASTLNSTVTMRKAAIDAQDSTDHRDLPQTKKRRLNLVKCDRCRHDKQDVRTFHIEEATIMADL
jgi:hypothetical protein